jgi:hypothetical protein
VPSSFDDDAMLARTRNGLVGVGVDYFTASRFSEVSNVME